MPPRRSMKRMVGTPLAANPEQSQIALRHGGTSQMTKVPAWRQEVTDEQGRRRLHGAFKGGYSAGYYNTVGSKEGWQPATFESSRTTRAAAAGNDQKNTTMQRALELMDDEDLTPPTASSYVRYGRPAQLLSPVLLPQPLSLLPRHHLPLGTGSCASSGCQ
ncbi:hypothetical protein BC828DRAFT_148763 [Blastocladiella britannica]|nr:hypothetical protein BC828DRAFT_148763 [Blastocladiella britannica]